MVVYVIVWYYVVCWNISTNLNIACVEKSSAHFFHLLTTKWRKAQISVLFEMEYSYSQHRRARVWSIALLSNIVLQYVLK